MRYLSLCSGIEAATAAWHSLGWKPVAFSEIEPFPSEVLAHRYPDVPNLGDMEKIDGQSLRGKVDLIVSGTPCQAFSVAGLRRGVADARGNLSLVLARLVDEIRPEWLVWENVPGVLSSNQGRDFGAIVGALAELGYGFCWRVLDAQYFGLAQRRKRVFLVARAGGESPFKVLFDEASVSRNPAPSRGPREEAAPGIADGSGVSHALNGKGGTGRLDPTTETLVPSHWDDAAAPHPTLNQSSKKSGGIGASNQEIFSQRGGGLVAGFKPNQSAQAGSIGYREEQSPTLEGGGGGNNKPCVLKVRGGADTWVDKRDGKTKGAGKGALVSEEQAFTIAATQDQTLFAPEPLPFDTTQVTHPENRSNPREGDPCHPLASAGHPPAIAFHNRQDPDATEEVSLPLGAKDNGNAVAAVENQRTTQYRVRRLTPRECERLQGFPDDFTQIPWRGKSPEDCPDGPRYKALGNSMAVPVMAWIGQQIEKEK